MNVKQSQKPWMQAKNQSRSNSSIAPGENLNWKAPCWRDSEIGLDDGCSYDIQMSSLEATALWSTLPANMAFVHAPQLEDSANSKSWSLKTTIFEAAILQKPTLQTLDTSGDCLHDFDQILNPEGFGQPAVKARGQALISPVLKGVCCDSHHTNFGVGPQLSDLGYHFHTSLHSHRQILPESNGDQLSIHKQKPLV